MASLSGIRVVTIALNAPGPLAAARLRDAGATVLKIEPPGGDPLKRICRGWYDQLHAGIDTREIDLKSGDGRTRMQGWLRDADLFLASQRPSALARLGLDAATLVRPGTPFSRLRHLNIVGELARPEIAGHDLTYLARAGLLGSEMPRTLVADVLGSEHAFSAALLLLRQPPGAAAQVGLFDALAPLTAPLHHGLTGPGSTLDDRTPCYRVYPAREGRVAVAALEPHFQTRLYEALALPEGADLVDAFRTRTAAEWEAWAEARDLPLNAVR